MTDLTRYISETDLEFVNPQEQSWLTSIFQRFNGYPSLEQLWSVMDEPWRDLRCDPAVMDQRISAYYAHPVWLLNGLFIEQHAESLQHRRDFADWVAAQQPRRVADYGGGFGGLARMIGSACPNAQVDVIEPHPHPLAIARAAQTPNVRYRSDMEEGYDVLIATDVFEHVPDPLGLVSQTAAFLRPGGQYLIANCFYPVILCHLPQTFHFLRSWDAALSALGLKPGDSVCYGRVYRRSATMAPAQGLRRARSIERRSRLIYRWQHRIPGRLKPWVFRSLQTPVGRDVAGHRT